MCRCSSTFDYAVVIVIIVNIIMIAANATAIIIVGAAAAFPCQLGDVANVSVPDGGSHYMYVGYGMLRRYLWSVGIEQ